MAGGTEAELGETVFVGWTGVETVVGVADFAGGVGGGGMAPFGGPYCNMGRKTG